MTLKLYTRHGCGLCEEAEEMLAEMLSEIELIDVDKDPAAVRLYGLRVPVLTRGRRAPRGPVYRYRGGSCDLSVTEVTSVSSGGFASRGTCAVAEEWLSVAAELAVH